MPFKVVTIPRVTEEMFRTRPAPTASGFADEVRDLEADLNEVGGEIAAVFQRDGHPSITYVIVRVDD